MAMSLCSEPFWVCVFGCAVMCTTCREHCVYIFALDFYMQKIQDKPVQVHTMQPESSIVGESALMSDATIASTHKRSHAFKVTFACRIPEVLRNNSGYGSIVGFMRFNKMRHDADAASWEATYANDDPYTVEDAAAQGSIRSATPDVAAKTPMSNDDVESDDARSEDAHGFESHRRHTLGISRDSSWVLASPCRSSGLVTPASIRRSASCATDDALPDHSDDDDAPAPDSNAPTSMPRGWDVLSHSLSPHHPAALHGKLPAAPSIRLLAPL